MGKRAVVGTVVALGLVVGGAVAADRVLHGQAEDRLARELQEQVTGSGTTPEVTIAGFPFLTQVLAGELDDVRASAEEATVAGLDLVDVEVRLRDVSTDRPYTAQEATLTAQVPTAAIDEAVDLELEVQVDGDHLVGVTEVLGLPLEVLMLPQAAGREIRVDVDGFRLGGVAVRADSLPSGVAEQLQGITVPVEQLPDGLELTDVTVVPGGVRLTAGGTDVVLSAAD